MQQNSPLVSIVIPCFNSEAWIKDCLDSIAAQTWSKLEIIVVDDGSTDRSAALIKGYPDSRIKYLYQPNAGPSAARNRGLGECNGAYIQFFDSDDIMHPRKIERQLEFCRNTTDSLVSCSWTAFKDVPGDIVPVSRQIFRDLSPREFFEYYLDRRKGDLPCPAFLCPRSVVEKTGRWNEALLCNNDGEYVARMVANSDRIIFTPDCTGFFYRRRADSVSKVDSSEKVSSWIASLDTIASLAASSGVTLDQTGLADFYRSLMIRPYPLSRPFVPLLNERIARYGGAKSKLKLGGSAINTFAALFGWKPARLIQNLFEGKGQ